MHAGKMEPFTRACVIIAGNHLAIRHFVAIAVPWLVFALICFYVLVFLFRGHGARCGGRWVRFRSGCRFEGGRIGCWCTGRPALLIASFRHYSCGCAVVLRRAIGVRIAVLRVAGATTACHGNLGERSRKRRTRLGRSRSSGCRRHRRWCIDVHTLWLFLRMLLILLLKHGRSFWRGRLCRLVWGRCIFGWFVIMYDACSLLKLSDCVTGWSMMHGV